MTIPWPYTPTAGGRRLPFHSEEVIALRMSARSSDILFRRTSEWTDWLRPYKRKEKESWKSQYHLGDDWLDVPTVDGRGISHAEGSGRNVSSSGQ